MLRSNLLVALVDLQSPTVLITSALAGEGKTATCANLAAVLAESGRRVVVVDVDLRHPNLHKWMGVSNEVGLTDVLLERQPLEDALAYVEVGTSGAGVYVLPTGAAVPNPSELLGSARTATVLAGLARQADILLLDTAPVLPVADTLVVGRFVTGAVLVVEARETPTAALRQAKDQLIRNHTRLLGVVINKLDGAADGAYGYGYPSTTQL